ncbi:oxygenase MpaB family protein [Phytohabitans rumicis]|uniref:ER-bound oxygenase mpaB/mpaB'/Rubber oxygenase catalytic domain-containing protein n=1 Tax=Phytohabitans rumicis TaxID=1076125 RepID=A0A6V8L1K6_9ACTN|nr:oxygenase MpaB family protein [Phytohabitans rumicis]GFJ91163.1 hypothetical protein Prum_048050 [Phytohabitans rumicis]
MAAEDLGLFGPDSVSWRLHEEPILLVAGLRSLYLQALHPLAVAAVVQNSDYKTDPWGRLVRTSTYVATTVYGTTTQAEAAGRRVRAIHARLRGTDPRTGTEFRVDEPDLLRWVHVAEVESFITTAKRAGVALSPADVDAYYAEQRRVAALIGLDPATVPGTAAEVADYYRRVRPELGMSKAAAQTFLFLTYPPLPWRLGLTPVRLAYFGLAGTAFGLLPPWARRMYGALGLPIADLGANLSVRGLRLLVGALPRRYRTGPIYKGAMERADRAPH